MNNLTKRNVTIWINHGSKLLGSSLSLYVMSILHVKTIGHCAVNCNTPKKHKYVLTTSSGWITTISNLIKQCRHIRKCSSILRYKKTRLRYLQFHQFNQSKRLLDRKSCKSSLFDQEENNRLLFHKLTATGADVVVFTVIYTYLVIAT